MSEIYIYPLDLKGINEAVTQNADGSYTIFYDDKLSPKGREEAVRHAMKHIENHDFERTRTADEIEDATHERD